MTVWNKIAKYVTETYDVEFNLTRSDDEDIYFRCPECDEYLLKEDWEDDFEEFGKGICPVCGFNFYEGE